VGQGVGQGVDKGRSKEWDKEWGKEWDKEWTRMQSSISRGQQVFGIKTTLTIRRRNDASTPTNLPGSIVAVWSRPVANFAGRTLKRGKRNRDECTVHHCGLLVDYLLDYLLGYLLDYLCTTVAGDLLG